MKLLVFDLGHVLIDFEWMAVCYAFSERCAKPTHEVLEAFSKVGKLGYEVGKVTTEQFLLELNKNLETNLSSDEFTTLWNTSFRENIDMAKYLELLGKSRKLCMLSNTNESHYNFIQSSFDVERLFHSKVLSYEVGYAKPQEEIYQAVLAEEDVKAEDCLFVDDLEINIEAAKEFGMNAIHFVGIEDMVSRLTDYGIKV